ncbi:hypothetical protein BDZ89DRAFT_916350, partial [Hymenopellis radicata]
YELEEKDWDAIALVSEWLKHFRHATTDMSTTKRPMLSSVHGVFRGLQEHLKEAIKALPEDTAPEIKRGLTDAHRKLSDYYSKFDASPYYL